MLNIGAASLFVNKLFMIEDMVMYVQIKHIRVAFLTYH